MNINMTNPSIENNCDLIKLLSKNFYEYDLTSLNIKIKNELIELTNAKNMNLFINSVEYLNSFKEKGGSKEYIRQLFFNKKMKINSPFDGSVIYSGSSIILDDKTTIFSFPSEHRILLSSGDMGAGYPICVAIFVEHGIIAKIFPHDWGFSLRHLPKLQESILISGWKIGFVTKSPILVTGDSNFAHNAWNQLPAILDLIEPVNLIDNTSIIATNQPLGHLENLFPEIKPNCVQVVNDWDLSRQNGPGNLFIVPGTNYLNFNIISRIIKNSYRMISYSFSELAKKIQSSSGPILWLSIRTINRTAVNLIEALTEIGVNFFIEYPNGTLIIDGYSTSMDKQFQPSVTVELNNNIVNNDYVAAEEIRKNINIIFNNEKPIHIFVGNTICESIILSGIADFYFCHHGTIQHKIGWFHKINGIVHSNTDVLLSNPAQWVKEQSEVASLPYYLPSEFIKSVENTSLGEFNTLLHHDNYFIENIKFISNMISNGIKKSIQEKY